MTNLIADDLFSGAGGWDLGAAALGIHARGVENMKEARATRDAAGLTTIHDDVWTFVPDGLASGLIASPPCQTFSPAGKGAGRKALDQVLEVIESGAWTSIERMRNVAATLGDERTALVLTPLHFATQYDYEWLAWEQVPTVLPVWEACAEVLRGLGWNVWTGTVQAEQYGVPQTRKRAILLASRTREVSRPRPTHSKYYPRNPSKLDEGVAKWVSMAEALGIDCAGEWRLNTTNTRDGEYVGRATTEPAPTVTGLGRSFRWSRGALAVENPGEKGGNPDDFRTAAEGPLWTHMRGNQKPGHGSRVDAEGYQVRSVDEPAPTLHFGQRCNFCAFEMVSNYGTGGDPKNRGRRNLCEPASTVTSKIDRNKWTHMGDVYNSNGCIRSIEEPAPTMTGSMDNGNFRWCDEANPPKSAVERIARQDLPEWAHKRPSTTIVGSFRPDVVAAPGYRTDISRQNAPNSVRVTVEEAGILQSFPADMPWQGSKSKQFLQVGNAVPPLLAAHVLAEGLGIDL